MSEYSFPNPADDLKSRLGYTVAAEFINRLDQFLEHEHREAGHGQLPFATIAVVKHCCEAAIDMLCELSRSWEEGSTTRLKGVEMRPEQLPVDSPMAAEMILETMEVLAARLPASAYLPKSDSLAPAKWELMFTLGTEFFLELGAMTEAALSDSGVDVDEFAVYALRGCLDAAMGMVDELMSVAWPEGQEVPARAVLAMHDHVTSCRLEDAGHEAMTLVRDVYDKVTCQVMGGH